MNSNTRKSTVIALGFLAIFTSMSVETLAQETSSTKSYVIPCEFWSELEYRFDEPVNKAGTVENSGCRPSYGGEILGLLDKVPGVINNAISLDGTTAHVKLQGSEQLDYSSGVYIEAFVKRSANNDEDAIMSKWFGFEDQWLLTFYNGRGENGSINFIVVTRDGIWRTVSYEIPNADYLNQWVHVAAYYKVKRNGKIGKQRLYWNGKLVARQKYKGKDMHIADGDQPIHIGDAGSETPWSRFGGAIDEVKITGYKSR